MKKENVKLQGGINPQNQGKFAVQYGQGYTSNLTPDMSRETNVRPLQRGKNPQIALNPQQIRAIRNAPKGVLPAFLNKAAGALGKATKKTYKGPAKAKGEK